MNDMKTLHSNKKVLTVDTRAKLDKIFTRLAGDENFHVITKTNVMMEVKDLLTGELLTYRYVQPNKVVFYQDDFIALMIHDGKEAAATYSRLDYIESVAFSQSEITDVPDKLIKQMQDFCDNHGIKLMRY